MAMFVSDAHEGSISDREIVIQSGFCNYLEKGDLVLADRGFNIEDLVLAQNASLLTPAFLKGRSRFQLKEESDSRIIARARIHVERFNQRLKLYKYVGDYIPQYKFPLINQAIFVCSSFVNLTQTFAK